MFMVFKTLKMLSGAVFVVFLGNYLGPSIGKVRQQSFFKFK